MCGVDTPINLLCWAFFEEPSAIVVDGVEHLGASSVDRLFCSESCACLYEEISEPLPYVDLPYAN